MPRRAVARDHHTQESSCAACEGWFALCSARSPIWTRPRVPA